MSVGSLSLEKTGVNIPSTVGGYEDTILRQIDLVLSEAHARGDCVPKLILVLEILKLVLKASSS